MNKHSILLTGATGYVGGRLLKVLEAQGHTINCIARTPAYLRSRVAATTNVFAADVLDKESLRAGLAGVDTAYYMIHSLGESRGFEKQEKIGAQKFAVVARESGVKLLRPCGAAEAMRAALENEDRKFAETRWSDSLSSGGTARSHGGYQFRNRQIDYREKQVGASPEVAFQVIESIGGNKGWFGYDFLWRWRGILDLLVGGIGMRRGRPTHRSLRPSDALDFWRVEELERPHKLRLLAEMKVPGRAWLEFVVEPQANGSVIRQTAIFDAIGLSGRIYWYCVYPLHALVFQDMIDSIASRVMRPTEARPAATEPGAATAVKQSSIHSRN